MDPESIGVIYKDECGCGGKEVGDGDGERREGIWHLWWDGSQKIVAAAAPAANTGRPLCLFLACVVNAGGSV